MLPQHTTTRYVIEINCVRAYKVDTSFSLFVNLRRLTRKAILVNSSN